MAGGGYEGVARAAGVAVLDADQPRVGIHAVTAGQQPVGVGDAVRPAVAGKRRLRRGAVPCEVRIAQPGPPEHREVVRRRHLPLGVVPVRRDDLGVEGAELAGLGLHLADRGLHAAVERRQHVHGVVAGVQEDPLPKVADPVGVSLAYPDQAAAGADVRQLLRGDGVFGVTGHCRQDGEREQRLEGTRGRQRVVGVVRGEHIAGACVGDHPGQRRHFGELGDPRVRSYLCPGLVQERGLGGRGPGGVGVRARDGDGGVLREGRRAERAERAAGDDGAG